MSAKPSVARIRSQLRIASPSVRARTQSRRCRAASAPPLRSPRTAAAESGSKASAGSTQAASPPPPRVSASRAIAREVRPEEGAPQTSESRPRGNPPPSCASRAVTPVGQKPACPATSRASPRPCRIRAPRSPRSARRASGPSRASTTPLGPREGSADASGRDRAWAPGRGMPGGRGDMARLSPLVRLPVKDEVGEKAR